MSRKSNELEEKDDLLNWNENETFATSEATSKVSDVELLKFNIDAGLERRRCCECSASYLIQLVLFIVLYSTPIIFLIIPKVFGSQGSEFNSEYNISYYNDNYSDIGTQGLIISLSLKTLILALSSLVYLSEKTRLSKLPQINLYKVIVVSLSYSVLFIFWIFYSFKVIHWEDWHYKPVIIFSSSYVDVLLFLHYFGIVMLYIRNKEVKYVLEVIRSTDGEARFYNCGAESIQTAGSLVLQKYYRDFPLYNPAQNHRSKNSRLGNANQSYKIYSIEDSVEPKDGGNDQRAILAAAARRRDAGQNERYYYEVEKERRIRKRKSRLEVAVEDAFALVRRRNTSPLSASDAAQEVWPTMARSMQKYLRTTRQHEHYNQEDCLDHLSFCFRHNMTATAFISRYVNKRPAMTYPGHLLTNTLWSISSDQPLLASLRHGVTFQLIQATYSLVVTVRKHPAIILREEYQDPKSFRYVVDLNQAESPV